MDDGLFSGEGGGGDMRTAVKRPGIAVDESSDVERLIWKGNGPTGRLYRPATSCFSCIR